MLITRETDYALRILRTLQNEKQLTAAEIAKEEQIPQQFAYKILKKLKTGHLVNIYRGITGGYVKTSTFFVVLYQLFANSYPKFPIRIY